MLTGMDLFFHCVVLSNEPRMKLLNLLIITKMNYELALI